MATTGRIEGRVALVTGAAAGIGEATARRLAADGARVVLADLDEPGVRRVAAEIEAGGGESLALRVDVTDSAAVGRMVERTVERFGQLDILANVAGGFNSQRTVEATSEEAWNRGLALNLTSGFLCAKAVMPHLIVSEHGRIIFVSSGVARVQVHFTAPEYVAGKAGIIALSWYLAKELGPHGVTVNNVAPGPIWSQRTRGVWSPDLQEQIKSVTPLGRIGDSEDVAATIAFLASDDARHISGATIDVNGGFTITH